MISDTLCPCYLAQLGGSHCRTQLTSGMSMPLAMTSVHTRIPLHESRHTVSDWFILGLSVRLQNDVTLLPLQLPETCEDLVPFLLHLAVDAADGDTLD